MASIRKHPQTQYWIACITLPSGVQTQRSTKIPNRERNRNQALALACRFEKAEQQKWKKKPEELKYNRELAMEFYSEALCDIANGQMTESKARDHMNKLLSVTGCKAIEVRTIQDTFERWLKGKEVAKKQKTHERYRKVICEFNQLIGDRVNESVEVLTAEDVEAFRDFRLKQGLRPTTVKLDLKIIRSALEWCCKLGIITTNPAAAVDLPAGESAQREVFTPEEVSRICEYADDDWKTAIMVSFYIGARLGDAVKLRWSNVDLSERLIDYKQQKTGKRVVCPMHDGLYKHLMTIAGDDPEGYLSPTLAPRAISGRSGLSASFALIMKKAGVDAGTKTTKAGRKQSARSFHSLRHSFASALANAGVPEEIRMKLTGHSSSDVHQKYTHMQINPLQQAVSVLPLLP